MIKVNGTINGVPVSFELQLSNVFSQEDRRSVVGYAVYSDNVKLSSSSYTDAAIKAALINLGLDGADNAM